MFLKMAKLECLILNRIMKLILFKLCHHKNATDINFKNIHLSAEIQDVEDEFCLCVHKLLPGITQQK